MSKGLIVRILLLFVFVTNAFSQPGESEAESMASKEFRPSIGLGMGMINYYGDVNSNENHGSFHNQFGYTIHVSRKINNSMDLGFSFLTGTIVGNERSAERNLNFKTSIYSGSVYVSYNFNHFLPENSILQPYVTLGFESFEYNNKSDLVDANGNKYFYWTDGTIRSIDQSSSSASQAVLMKRDYVYETDLRAANLDGLGKYAQLSIGVPLGIGVNMRISERVNFKIGSTFHFTFTDLIDNVSKNGSGVRQGSSTPDFFMFNSLSLHYDLLNTPKRVNLEDFDFPDFFVLDMVDQDKDGVVDGFDACPYTPEGVKVDENGCPLDGDDDGVPDYMDKEFATIDTSFVNSDGITLTDEDFHNQYLRYIDSVDIPIDILYRIAGKPQKSATYRILLGEFSGRLPEDLARDFLDEGDVFGALTKGGKTAYLAGEYGDINEARKRQEELLAKGMPQATIVVWEGNDFITLKRWEEKSKKEVDELYKDEIKKKKDLNGMYAVKLGNTAADANTIDKLKYFEYEDVVVLGGDKNSNDYVVGPFIDSVGASQILQEVDRNKFPEATIVKVRNGKATESGINTDEIPVNENPKGASAWNSPKYEEKEASNKALSKLENSYVIDFGSKKDPKTKALIERIKQKADVVEIIDPQSGNIKLITKDRKTKSVAEAEVAKLKLESVSTAKVAKVKNGQIVSVKPSRLKDKSKEGILSKLEDAFVIDFGSKNDPETKSQIEKIKAKADVIEVIDPKDGSVKLITKTPKSKAVAKAEVAKLQSEGVSTAKVSKVKNGQIVPVKSSELNDNNEDGILSKLEDTFVIDFGSKKDPETKALIEKIKAKADVIEVIDPKDGSTKLITKDPKSKSVAKAEVEKLHSEGISTAKVSKVKHGQIVPVKPSELNNNSVDDVLSKLEDSYVIDFGSKNDPETKALIEKIKARVDVIEVIDPKDGSTKLITKDPKTKAVAKAEVAALKAEGISTAKVSKVKNGQIVPVKPSELNKQGDDELSKLEDSYVIDFGSKKDPKTKALIERIKAKADVVEVIDPKDGSIKLITKDPKTKSEAASEIVKLKSEGISTAKLAKVENGKIVPVKPSQLRPNEKEDLLSKLENAFVIDFGSTKDSKTKALIEKIKANSDVIEVIDSKDGSTKLISRDPKTKEVAEAEVKKLKAKGISTAKVARVQNGGIIPVKGSELNKAIPEGLSKIEKEFVVRIGTIDKNTSLVERQKLLNVPNTVKIKNDDGSIDIVSKLSHEQEEPAHIDKAKYKRKGFLDSKVAYVKNGKVEVLKKEALDGKFTLSLGSFKSNVPNKQVNEIASISDVESMETFNPDVTTYTVGNFDNPEEAKQRMEELVSQGFKPELVKYEDGKIKVIDLGSVFDKMTLQKLADLKAKQGLVKTGGVVFRVQLGAYRGKINETVFRGVKTLAFPSAGGVTKYVTGSFGTYQQSYISKLEMKKLGFSGAFVVAYKDGHRISVTDLVNKEKFQQVKESVSPIEKQLNIVEEKPKKKVVKKVVATSSAPVKNKISYRVQIGAFKDDAIQNKLTEFPDVTMEVYGQYKRYTSGSFPTYAAASKHKAVIKAKGFKGAFVVAYNGGERVAAPGENTNVIKTTDLVDAVKSSPVKSEYDANKLMIMVQVGLYRGSIPADLKSLFNTLPNITKQVTPHGVVRYMTGNFKTPSEAAAYKEDLVKQGFAGAFLVAYYDNDRIKIQKAIEISQGK